MTFMRIIKTTPVTFGGPTAPGSVYYNFKNDIKSQYEGEKWTGRGDITLALTVYILRSRIGPNKNDLDNFLKPIIDALAEERYFTEEQMAQINIERSLVDFNAEEGVSIQIREHSPV